MKSFLYLVLGICLVVTSVYGTTEKIYIDEQELDMECAEIRIHIGDNTWIQTSTLHNDQYGIYTLENEIIQEKEITHKTYQRTWKCPYCYRHWPIGEKCGNKECPSKYM